GPLTADRVTAQDGQPQVGEEGDRRLEGSDRDPDVLQRDGHAVQGSEPRRSPHALSSSRAGQDFLPFLPRPFFLSFLPRCSFSRPAFPSFRAPFFAPFVDAVAAFSSAAWP